MSKHTLDILIPTYNETIDVVTPLLDSLNIQQGVDLSEVGVIICCDGGTFTLPQDFDKKYNYSIEFHKCEHKGVSATRNACLDYSTADYVMFCDCDDMFYNMCGLWILFREIKDAGGFNTLVSCFVEESRNPQNKEQILYINHDMDSTFVHGKVHKRQYLIDEKIRWNEQLTIHEDSYFNCLCQKLAGEKGAKYCSTPFYLWKWRDESVCRHDPKYILKTYPNMIESNTALVNEFIKRNRTDDAKFYIAGLVYDAFWTMSKDEWINQENKDYRYTTEKRFQKYWDNFKPMFESLSKEQKTMVAAGIRQRMFAEGVLDENQTFDQWIKTIEELD